MIFSDLATPPLGSALSLFPSLLFFSLSLSLSLCSFPMRAPEDGVCEDDDVYKKRGKGEKKGPPPPKNLGFFKHQFKVSQKRSSSRLLLREAQRDDGNRLGQKRRQKKKISNLLSPFKNLKKAKKRKTRREEKLLRFSRCCF